MRRMTWKPPANGALDDTQWPEQLVARAIEAGTTDDRLHGYAVLTDVCRHYRYSDLIYLAIVGELPTDRASLLFHVGLCAWSSLSVKEAPVHVSLLSRVSAGRIGSAIAAGTIALADQTRLLLERHAQLLDWLRVPDADVPVQYLVDGSAALHDTLLALGIRPRFARRDMTREAASLALLFEAGLVDPEQLQAAIITARTTSLVAESLATGPRDLSQYPVKLPPFHYVEEESAP